MEKMDKVHIEISEETVDPDDVCPDCHEDRVDLLIWNDDGEYVTCAICRCVYVP